MQEGDIEIVFEDDDDDDDDMEDEDQQEEAAAGAAGQTEAEITALRRQSMIPIQCTGNPS